MPAYDWIYAKLHLFEGPLLLFTFGAWRLMKLAIFLEPPQTQSRAGGLPLTVVQENFGVGAPLCLPAVAEALGPAPAECPFPGWAKEQEAWVASLRVCFRAAYRQGCADVVQAQLN